MSGRAKIAGSETTVGERTRPDHFSTYVPRSLVRRLKVVATIKDIPLWVLVTLALEDYLDAFQSKHGQLPALDDGSSRGRE